MKRSALLLCLLASSLALAQDTVRVSYRTPAVTAKRALAEIGKLARLRLEANPQMEGELLVIAVDQAPIGELMERIALATSGRWDPIEGGYKLLPDTTVRQREEREERARKVEAIRKAIDKRVEEMQKKPAAGSAPAPRRRVQIGVGSGGGAFGSMGGGGSAGNAITRLLQGLDPAALASVDAGERLVFASRPTRMQLPLPGPVGKIVGDFIAEHNKGLAGKEKAQIGLEEQVQSGQIPSFIGDMVGRATRPIPPNPAKILLVVSRLPFLGMTNVELRLYGAQGETLFSTMSQLRAEGLEELIAASQPGTAPTAGTAIEYSEASKSLMAASSGGIGIGGPGLSLKMGPEIRAKLFRPDVTDPLSLMPSDALLSLAKLRKKPLVASPPDAMVSFATFFSKGKDTVEAFEKTLGEGKTATVVKDDAWIVVRPAEPAQNRSIRTDRPSLAALLATVEKKGVPSLDDVAAYALKNPSPMEGGIGGLYVMMFAPGAFNMGMNGFTSWEMLRLYGALPQTQRSALLAGNRLPIGSLSAIARAQVQRLTFGSMAMLEVERPGEAKAGDEMPFMGMIRMFTGGSKDYKDEPTEALPNGLPGNAYVELRGTSEPVALAVGGEGQTASGSSLMGPEELATLRFLKESMGNNPAATQIPQPDKVRLGQRSVMEFAFRLAPGISVKQTLMDNSVPKDGPVVTMENLPADFQKRIDDKIAALKKSPMGAFGAMMGQRRVTPP